MAGEVIINLISDYLAAMGFGLSGTAGGVGTLSLNRLLQKRIEGARDILLDEIKKGHRKVQEIPEDDAAAITFRYMRAASEGAARLNLRLLAAVIAGEKLGPSLYADDFLATADSLASLRREEIIVLGVVQKLAISSNFDRTTTQGGFWTNCLSVLAREQNMERDIAEGYAAASMRSGYLRFLGGLMDMGHAFVPTEELRRLSSILEVEGIRARHEAT